MGKFRISTRDLEAGIRRKLAENDSLCRAAMSDASQFMLKEARRRAPIDEGVLTNSISAGVDKRGQTTAAVVYVPVNSPAAEYAIPMHEGVYQIGEKSQRKQAVEGVPVGAGYLERAISENEKTLMDIVAAKVKEKMR